MIEVTAGIDIGGIDTDIGIADQFGKLYQKVTIITTDFEEPTSFIKKCYEVIVKISSGYELRSVGVAAPNGNHYTGTIDNPVNIRWKGIIPFADRLQKAIGKPVVLTNDAKAAAVGERIYGGARGMDNFVLVTLGTGLGSGIFCHGRLLTGYTGIAGEMGHMIVEADGRICNTKRKGCLEAYASVTGIVRTVAELLSDTVSESILRNLSLNELGGEHISRAAASGDKLALEAFELTSHILGRALANVASLFDPQAIFLGGGLARAGDLLIKPTQRYFDENVFPALQGKIKIQQSHLLNENGGILGACALAWQQ